LTNIWEICSRICGKIANVAYAPDIFLPAGKRRYFKCERPVVDRAKTEQNTAASVTADDLDLVES